MSAEFCNVSCRPISGRFGVIIHDELTDSDQGGFLDGDPHPSGSTRYFGQTHGSQGPRAMLRAILLQDKMLERDGVSPDDSNKE